MIVLDTPIWLWWINDDQRSLGLIRQEQIASAEVAAVSNSCFDVAWLERHRRIALPCPQTEWFDKALSQSGIVLLPISPAIASRAVDLHEHHIDPQDRIIIASAIEHNARLMSDDSKFAKYAELEGCLM